MPAWVLALSDDAETGAVAVVDRGTGQILVPESRYYPRKGQMTTEVSISQADFLIDVYVSMQPDMGGAPYVKVFTVIFPFVNFLWLGGLLMLIGAVVALSPRWVGQTLQSFFSAPSVAPAPAPSQPGASAAGVALLIAAGVAGLLALMGGVAHAHEDEAPQGGVEPHGFPVLGSDPLAGILGAVDCACGEASPTGRPSLGDPACACAEANAERVVIAELFEKETAMRGADGRVKYEVLKALVTLDGVWESRLRFDENAYRDLVKTTRTTCPGEFLMTLDASRSTCEFKIRWLSAFRLLLASGVPREAVFDYYLAENNATMAERMNGGAPWAPHELRTSDEVVATFWVPIALASGAVLLVLLLVLRNFRRRPSAPSREERGTALSQAERERLDDELEIFDA